MLFLTLTTLNTLISGAHREHLPNRPSTCTSDDEGAITGRSALQLDYVHYGLGDTRGASEQFPADVSAPTSKSSTFPKNSSLLDSPSSDTLNGAPSLLDSSASSDASKNNANMRILESDIQVLDAEVQYRKEEVEVKELEYERAQEEWNNVEAEIKKVMEEEKLLWREDDEVNDEVDSVRIPRHRRPRKSRKASLLEFHNDELKEFEVLEDAARQARETEEFVLDEQRSIAEQLTKAQATHKHLRHW